MNKNHPTVHRAYSFVTYNELVFQTERNELSNSKTKFVQKGLFKFSM